MTEPDHTEPDPDAQLDSLRIRQTAALRRSLYRSRAYATVAAIACAAGAAQCAWLAFRHIRAVGWGVRPLLFVGLMLGATLASILLARRALALNREAKGSMLAEPTTPPDFSSLSDGSQQVRNLDEVQ